MSTKLFICFLSILLSSFLLYKFVKIITSESVFFSFNPIEDILDTEKRKYHVWKEKQEILKLNIDAVCKKYGKSVRIRVPMKEFMYDSQNNLLFCRNAKVSYIRYRFIQIINNIISF